MIVEDPKYFALLYTLETTDGALYSLLHEYFPVLYA